MQYSKLKTLLIYNILEKYSDEEHPLSTTDLISMLEEKGVKCERKSIYADIAALNEPRSAAARASSHPILPDEKFVINLTASSLSRVAPAVTSTRLPS